MANKMVLKPARFLLLCLMLGVLCEQCFFHGQMGAAFPLFVFIFYCIFLWRYHGKPMHHHRMGTLMMVCIGILSVTYVFYDNFLFYLLNILIIPFLVICHCILITSPKNMLWHQRGFISYVFKKIKRIFTVNLKLSSIVNRLIKKRVNEKKYEFVKKLIIGIVISLPLLLIILVLLVSADAIFGELLSGLPNWIAQLNIGDFIPRFVIIMITSCIFFGFFQGLHKGEHLSTSHAVSKIHGDQVITTTVLSLINAVYTLFTIVQFRYFFGGKLVPGLTYAEYARHGFFQLLLVTVINLTILVIIINLMKGKGKMVSIQILLTLLVTFSGIMLWSAFKRLLLYEDAYGFTVTRMLAHAFMIFLIIIFAYTLVKIWIRHLSLIHFYVTSILIFYTALNLVHMDRWVVDENISRYNQTGKIDVDYLNNMSYTGVLGLIELYRVHPDIPRLNELLALRKKEFEETRQTWQSYNLTEVKVQKALKSLHLSNNRLDRNLGKQDN